MTYHARVTEAGELVFSADLARELGLSPGDAIEVENDVDRRNLRLVSTRPRGQVRDTTDRFLAERASDWDE